MNKRLKLGLHISLTIKIFIESHINKSMHMSFQCLQIYMALDKINLLFSFST